MRHILNRTRWYIVGRMEIRPARIEDLDGLIEIDATIHSAEYAHIERSGEGLGLQWRIEQRPLREPRVERNRLGDEARFVLKQIASGADEGLALVAEHDALPVALLVAQPRPRMGTMKLIDLRVDFDHRRQGLAMALLFQAIARARELELRAFCAECPTNNFPAISLFLKLAFELGGLDTHRYSNHDLVKEAATLFWYAPLS